MWSQVRITKVPSFLTFFFHSVILWEQLDPDLAGLVEAARPSSSSSSILLKKKLKMNIFFKTIFHSLILFYYHFI